MTPAESAVRRQDNRAGGGRARLRVFGALAVLLILAAAMPEWLCPFDPYAQDFGAALQPPSPEHFFGTDRYGRDLLSRVIAGSRASICGTILLVALITGLGTAVGVFAGWTGGRLDAVLMRLSDMFLAFPGLVFALAVAGVLGGGLHNAIFALAAISWPKYARMARSQTFAVRESAFMKAARLSGSPEGKIIRKHLLPNIAGPILVTAMLDIGTMMMELAGLSFLGLGAKPPAAEWGSMMSESRGLLTTVPWSLYAPGLAIFVSVIVFNLLGDAVRDALDPKMKER